MVARRYLIRGVVQAVGFRFFTEDTARREGIGGFVRNLDSGHVEAVVEGEAQAVARFERAVRQGPPMARIDAMEIEDLAPTGRVVGFRIR